MRLSFLGRLSLLLVCALCLFPATSYGQNTAPWSERDGLVVIRTASNPLQPEDEARLEALLQTRLDSTGARLVIVLIDGIQDDINLYAVELAQSWGIGSADEDNGAILLVDLENRNMALQVGYGLEDELPDITCSQIIDNELVPLFKAGDIVGGLEAGQKLFLQPRKANTGPKSQTKKSCLGLRLSCSCCSSPLPRTEAVTATARPTGPTGAEVEVRFSSPWVEDLVAAPAAAVALEAGELLAVVDSAVAGPAAAGKQHPVYVLRLCERVSSFLPKKCTHLANNPDL